MIISLVIEEGAVLPDGGHLEDVPLHRGVELGQVHPQLHHVGAACLVDVPQVHLSTRRMSDSTKYKFGQRVTDANITWNPS